MSPSRPGLTRLKIRIKGIWRHRWVRLTAVALAVPAVLQLRGRWALLRRQAGTVVVYGVVAIAGGQLCYFNAIESIPIGLAMLLEYLGVVLIVGWLWAVRDQRPG